MPSQLPIRDSNSILEETSELYFRQQLPPGWLTDKPRDFGIDLLVGIVQNNQVTGLNFSVQLKSANKIKGKPLVSLKTSTINYLLNRLEPVMIVLYDGENKKAYWKWLRKEYFNLTKKQATHSLHFDADQCLHTIDWAKLSLDVQGVFKIQKQLLTALEYDLFSHSELESKAWAHYITRNLQEAAFYFKRLLEKEEKPLTLLALAQCEYSLYDYGNALMHINRALELEQTSNLFSTKGTILAEDGIQNNDFYKLKQAEAIFNQLYKESPTAINAYNYANTLSHLKTELGKAEELYKKAVELEPGYAEAWKNLGQLYYDLRKHKKELWCYEKALKINPKLQEARISKGITLSSIYNRHEEAIKEINEGIELDPKIFIRFPLIYYWMSRILFSNNNISEALKWANKGLNHYPGHFNIREVKARIMINNLDDSSIIAEAVDFFEEGRHLHPKDTLNFYYWCESKLKIGEEQTVLNDLTEWLNSYLSININREFLKHYSLNNLLLIPKHWSNTATYFEIYEIKQDIRNLEGLENIENFLNYFEIARAIFISLVDIELSYKKTSKEYIDQCIKLAFFPLPLEILAQMVTARRNEPENFANQVSCVITYISMLYLVEVCRSVGFLVGKSQRYVKVEKLVDPTIHKELMSAIIDVLTILDDSA